MPAWQAPAIVCVGVLVRGTWSWEIRELLGAWDRQIILNRHRKEKENKKPAHLDRVIVQHVTLLSVTSGEVILAHPKATAAPVIKRKLGSKRRDVVHEVLRPRKRDGDTCPKDYQMCPRSLNGGCCPKDTVCGENGCLPSAATTASACGRQNFFACGLEHGGGCCPNNHECGQNGCTPLPGAISTLTCGINSYLCPASVNYGCCKVGLGCGVENCYSTGVSSFTLTQIITTTDAQSREKIFTTTITSETSPYVPAETTSRGLVAGVVPKVSSAPNTIPKTEATPKPSGGLTSAQLGGIIGGAVGLLLVLLLATFVILRRLNKAIKASAGTKTQSKASNDNAGVKYHRPSASDIDAMSVDPLMISPSEMSGTPRFASSQSTPFEADSSPVFRSPFPPPDAPHTTYQTGYNAVATSDAAASWNRHGSMESTPSMRQSVGSYFDIPSHDPRHSYQYQNGRHWSDASLQSVETQAVIELDAGADGSRRSSLQRALHGGGNIAGRRRSGSSTQLEGSQKDGSKRAERGHSPPGNSGQLGHSLGFIPEAGESGVHIPTLSKLTGGTH